MMKMPSNRAKGMPDKSSGKCLKFEISNVLKIKPKNNFIVAVNDFLG